LKSHGSKDRAKAARHGLANRRKSGSSWAV
jgi:hypothetical protein